MYNVLIVDDHESTLNVLGEQLEKYGDVFIPVYANNGLEALDIIHKQTVSLLVTDLIMPGKFDGWDLIQHIEQNNLSIPCIVITSCEDTDKIEQVQKKARLLMFKPVQVEELAETITSAFNENFSQDSRNGFSIFSFLKHLETEGRTCLLEILDSKGEAGFLYIEKGEMYDAIYKGIKGKEAACLLIAMQHSKLNIIKLPNRKIPKRINDGIIEIIAEAKQVKDDVARKEDVKKKTGDFLSHSTQKEDMTMSLEQQLESLRSIKGYKASGLMNYTGEVLAVDTIDDNVDLENVGAVFNDIFRSSHEAAGKVGLKACNELAMKTPNGLIIMACSGVDAPVHFHMIAIMDSDGNQALVKMQFDKMIAKITDELS